MKNTKFFCFGTLILFLFLNTVNSTSCYITSCTDIRSLAGPCPVVYLNATISLAGSQTCITMQGQILDLNGHTITGFGGYNSPFRFVYVIGSGMVKNGVITQQQGSGTYAIQTSSQTGSMIFQNLTIGSAGNDIFIGTGTGTTYINNVNTTSKIVAHNNIQLTDIILSGGTSGIDILENGLTLEFTRTQIYSTTNAIDAHTKNTTTININSGRFCSNTKDLYFDTTPEHQTINNLGNEFYYDVLTGNYTLSGNIRRSCFEFNGTWGNETENETVNETTNETDKICSTNYDDLSDFGLYDLWMVALRSGTNTSAIEKYAFKIKVQDRTLLNSMNISNGTLCLKKLGSSFEVCKIGVHSDSMYDTMVNNLAGYNWSDIQHFKGAQTADFIDQYLLTSLYIAANTQMIGRTYCNENNQNCVLGVCACEGYYYEFPVSEMESGDYAVYLDLTNNSDTSCVYRLYQQKTYLGGALSQTLTDLGYSESPVSGGTEKIVKKKLISEAAYKNIGSGDNCNLTLTTIGTAGLKSEDILFYLTANTTTNYYTEGEVIEQKLAIYDVVNKNYYQVFDICSEKYTNMTSVGHFWRIRDAGLNEWVAADNNGYIGTTNKTVGGGATTFYYYYNSTYIILYNTTEGVQSSDNANDRYWTQPQATDWTTYLIYALIGVFAIMVFYVIAMMFTKKSK